MNTKKFTRLIKGGVSLLTISSFVLLSGQAQAAKEIYQLNLGRDTIARDGNVLTGDYLSVQYGVRDMAAGQAYNALVFTKVASSGDMTPTTAANGSYFPLTYGGWVGESAGSVKIDADRVSVTATPYGFYRMELKGFINPLPTAANWPMLTPANKTSMAKYFVLFPLMTITNFDVDGKTQAGTVIDPVILKQDNATTTGDYIQIARAFTGAASTSLMASTKVINLPAGAANTNLDADLLPPGKYPVKLKAYVNYFGKEKALFSSNSFTITVLSQPKFTKFSITDATATRDNVKPSSCSLTTNTVTGDDKVVFKYDGVGLTAATLQLTNGTNSYSFKLTNPNALGKLAAVDTDCMAPGTYSARVDYENTSNYKATLTSTTPVVVN